MRYWNIARQRYCCGSARCLQALRLSADRAENAASKPARKAGVLDPEEKVPRETDSPLEGEGFEPSVPRRGQHFFETASEPGDDKPARQPQPDFDDRQGQVYRAPSQADPGNDINAGSLGFQKAPMRGPASLVAIRL